MQPVSPGRDRLADRAARAAQWRFAAVVVAGVSQLAIGALLSRILAPADFGIATFALVVLGLVQPLGDLGIAAAIVQRPALTDRHLRIAFTFSTLLGVFVCAAIVTVAPTAAGLMRAPHATMVLRVLSAAFAIRGVAVVAGALLRRRLDFRRQFFIESVSYIAGYGGVALTLAVLGYGAWSLVWGFLAQTLLVAIAQVLSARHSWRPLLVWRELGSLLHFGVGASVSGSANYIALNGDNFVAGRWLGAGSLGLYDRAYSLMNLPYVFAANVVSTVMFPAFAQVQGEPAVLRRGYLLTTRLTAMVAGPAMVTMAVAAPHLVPSLYGPAWMGVVVPLQILCAAGYFRALYHLGGAVAQSAGRVYSELGRQVVYASLVIGGALFGARYGLAGIATGVSLAILYMFVAAGQLALRISQTSWRAYLIVQLPALVTAAATLGVAFSARLVLDAWQCTDLTMTAGILFAATVPWTIGIVWTLREPDAEPLLAHVPASCIRLLDAVPVRRRLAFESSPAQQPS